MLTVEARNALSKNIEKVESELNLVPHALNEKNRLRVSNLLLAAGRTAGAVSRQSFIEELSEWFSSLEEELNGDKLKKNLSFFQRVLEREHDKHRLEVELTSIQSAAETDLVSRETIAKMLRNLADEVESGEYSALL